MENTNSEQTRKLFEISQDIRENWKNIYFGAVPYLNAMSQLRTINDKFELESASNIVRYFLSNATTWRGENARRIKLELNNLLK